MLSDDIYRIKFSDVAVWQKELVDRYNSLVAMSKELPSSILTPEFSASDDHHLSINEISKWFTTTLVESQTASTTDNLPPSTNKVALTLALCGWTGEKIAGVQFAHCHKCFSRVGFWLYQKQSDDESMKLDPVTLHRTHCPWQNAESQQGLGNYAGLAGWQILAQVISVQVSRRERGKRENLVSAGDDRTESGSIGFRPSTGRSTRTREEVDLDDKTRESKLAKLKKAFTVKRAKSRASLKSTKSNVTSSTNF
jgi:Rsm1-like